MEQPAQLPGWYDDPFRRHEYLYSQDNPFGSDDVFGLLILLPLYVSLFLYAFGWWTPREEQRAGAVSG